jgi:hypothetical protein
MLNNIRLTSESSDTFSGSSKRARADTNADINDDCKIDMRDIGFTARHFLARAID